jgi:DNA oxidative demethylase
MGAQLALIPRSDVEIIPDFWLLPNFLTSTRQEALVKLIRERCPKGWSTPTMPDGTPFSVKIFCFGFEWSIRGYKPAVEPMIWDFSELALQALDMITARHQTFIPQTAIISHYGPNSKLGLHRDRQEDERLQLQGSPIVTVALGDDCFFQVRNPTTNALHEFVMESGDCIVMHARSRLCEHGVKRIVPGSSPIAGLKGRLSITIRQVHP